MRTVKPPHLFAAPSPYLNALSFSFAVHNDELTSQVEKTGGPEVNVMREIPVPTPKADEVLIKIEWTGANYIDNCE